MGCKVTGITAKCTVADRAFPAPPRDHSEDGAVDGDADVAAATADVAAAGAGVAGDDGVVADNAGVVAGDAGVAAGIAGVAAEVADAADVGKDVAELVAELVADLDEDTPMNIVEHNYGPPCDSTDIPPNGYCSS